MPLYWIYITSIWWEKFKNAGLSVAFGFSFSLWSKKVLNICTYTEWNLQWRLSCGVTVLLWWTVKELEQCKTTASFSGFMSRFKDIVQRCLFSRGGSGAVNQVAGSVSKYCTLVSLPPPLRTPADKCWVAWARFQKYVCFLLTRRQSEDRDAPSLEASLLAVGRRV